VEALDKLKEALKGTGNDDQVKAVDAEIVDEDTDKK
jgi:hypothetical protein